MLTTAAVPLIAYWAPDGFADVLQDELRRHAVRVLEARGQLVLAERAEPFYRAMWAQNIWLTPRFIPVASVSGAAHALCALQRNWCLAPTSHHRRAALIAEKLPHVAARPQVFGAPAPAAPLGGWTLWEPDLLLASPACSSPFPNGEVRFVEDKVNPSSRAYLKLWELFTLFPQVRPAPGDLCLDLGAAPGGWSYVLGTLGARVFAIDKAPLASQVEALPTVQSCLGSGFGLDPRHAGAVDWLFSDMICYPERLYEGIARWLELGECRHFVCTIKCQGQTNHAVLDQFAAVPGSTLLHLSCNKHELTWVCLPPFAAKDASNVRFATGGDVSIFSLTTIF